MSSRGIRMPSEEDVPPGPHRELLHEVFHMFRQAGRPTLRAIAARAKQMDLAGTASQETIRRLLKGTYVPERWETMFAIYGPLCALADVDPDEMYVDDEDTGDRYNGPEHVTHREIIRERWDAAVDGEGIRRVYRTKIEAKPPSTSMNDPWASATPAPLGDEPPF